MSDAPDASEWVEWCAGPERAELGSAIEIRVTGTVQGVGFRPAVWRLAQRERLVGEVRNDGEGVLIRIGGAPEAIARLLIRLAEEPPPLAIVERIFVRRLPAPLDADEFRIVASVAGETRTELAADAGICAACTEEILDPQQRRFGYPFANCTDCGPRFSIITAMPYDRARTTMAAFTLCAACRREYEQPEDRRFHAQPIACSACGPRVWLERLDDGRELGSGDPIAAAAAALIAGEIVAIRGLGGFHLACDASDGAAIERLRERKRRDSKPLALMATDATMVRRYASLDALEQRLFESVEAPIVIVRRLPRPTAAVLPEALAPGLDTLGFMRPYTPLHLLLLRAVDRPLVMTSGNLSDEPQAIALDDARLRLRGVADLALMHDREIVQRVDDSLVRVIAGRPRLLRRARGFAPRAIRLPEGFAEAPPLWAFGADQKASFCLLDAGAAVLSQHIGDLDDLATHEDYEHTLRRFAELLDHRPQLLVADLHPEYRSTRLALELGAARSLPVMRVQHHHAHVAGCMAEHGLALDGPPVLGVALDGLGYADDGGLWGGEFLLSDYRGFRRLGSLAPVALPGGVRAILEPWRNLYAQLRAAFGVVPGDELFAGKPIAAIDQMIETGLSSPMSSSTGRLFDAVAAALGIDFDQLRHQASAAMELEALAAQVEDDQPYPFAERRDGALVRLDPAPMWSALLDDLRRGIERSRIAARFHIGLAHAVAELAVRLARGHTQTVVLSGGCWQNRILLERVIDRVEALGLRCLANVRIPANDGGVAFGQAVVAAARCLQESS